MGNTSKCKEKEHKINNNKDVQIGERVRERETERERERDRHTDRQTDR